MEGEVGIRYVDRPLALPLFDSTHRAHVEGGTYFRGKVVLRQLLGGALHQRRVRSPDLAEWR